MCTVITSWRAGEPLHVLAIRDEMTDREFDEPGAWWPEHPGVVGGRDRVAGGSWCVSDVASGRTALLVNRTERRTGTPSRGLLPLLALEHGDGWPEHVDVREMASCTLVLAGPSGVAAWEWTGELGASLVHRDLAAGLHVVTSSGVDPDTPKMHRYAPRFAATAPADWLDVVADEGLVDDLHALFIRHPGDDGIYGTVFGQLLITRPGELRSTWSRTPWQADDWRELVLPQPVSDRPSLGTPVS